VSFPLDTNVISEWTRPRPDAGIRVLPVDEAMVHACGVIVAQREALGRPIHAMDALIAATAKTRRLTVVTRNLNDFAPSVEAINPWKGD